MTKTEYLYGKYLTRETLDLQKIVCLDKIVACNQILGDLLEVPYEARDTDRINSIMKARKFNEQILLEDKE